MLSFTRPSRRACAVALALALSVGASILATAKDEAPASKVRKPIYDERADARADIAHALENAQRENKRVLIQYGGNWCGWCYKLDGVFTDHPDIRNVLATEYELVMVDSRSNKDLAEEYGTKMRGVPFLTVLDANGKKLVDQATGPLEIGDHHDPAKVLAFLQAWKAPPLDAEDVFKQALAKATEVDKRLLVHFGSHGCGWCRKLEAFMNREDISTLLARDYLPVKIDMARMERAKALQTRLSPKHGGGIPWYAIVDKDGHVLSTSDGPQGNAGYPVKPTEISHFMAMIEKSARNLTPQEIAAIEGTLKKAAEEILNKRKG